MGIDAYKFQFKSKKPTLDPWDVIVQVNHGQVDATGWDHIAFAGCERYVQDGFSGTPGVSYHSTGMVIQKGSPDVDIFIGDVMKPFSDDYCTIGLNFLNKRTGKYLYNTPTISTSPYKVSWGNLPCGDPYIHEEISKDEYDNMPGVPISDHAILEANGYHDWEPGAPLDIFINSNYWEWKVLNKNAWFTTEQPDKYTLRVRAIPKDASDDSVRSGKITLYSAAWDVEELETLWWNKVYTLYFSDSDADISGEDYQYGDNQNWD